ncbi:MAG: DsrE/DsrF/DrsH-like family protein [Methanomassiliicoccales archaeon]
MADEESRAMAIVVSEGSYDKAMMPLIMGTTGASMGMDVHIFFTFFGLNLLKKGANPKLPGLFRLMTGWFKKRMKKVGVEDFAAQMEMAKEMGVKLYACSTTMNVMGMTEEQMIEGISVLGAASFLDIASEAEIQLFIG